MVMPLDSPQPVLSLPSLTRITDTPEEKPEAGLPLGKLSESHLSPLVFGGASFSTQYNDEGLISSLVPLRTVRTALRYGITAFDTSAYYGPSEIVLGTVLKTLEPDFPRSTYQLMTKCGRYGTDKEAFDYSPKTIRRSVERSLARLNTDYLDVVYLHDVEFVAESILPRVSGDHTTALSVDAREYGLEEDQEGKIYGEGDQRILDAYGELRRMQSEGLIRKIGITGYPLPTLLRLALLILHNPPFKPIDILLSYSHSNMQNTAFVDFAPHFRKRARVGQLIAASPLSMGLLTPAPPAWHPAPAGLRAAIVQSCEMCKNWPGGLPNVALGFAMRKGGLFWRGEQDVDVGHIPTVVGLSSPREVHEAVRVWRSVQEKDLSQRMKMEREVTKIISQSGFYGWSWASPPENISNTRAKL